MKVFKFGGASVKDAEGVMNVARVLKTKVLRNVCLSFRQWGKQQMHWKLLWKTILPRKIIKRKLRR